VALNALTSGAYATTAVLPGENASEYEALLRSLQQDFAPANAVEAMLVTDLANLLWKKRRLDQISHQALVSVLSQPVSDAELKKALNLCSVQIPDAVALYATQALQMSAAEAREWSEKLRALRSSTVAAGSDLDSVRLELEADAPVWIWQNKDAIERALELARTRRTLAAIEQPGVTRAADDLSRALFRTLAELRKLKEWHPSVRATLDAEEDGR
jgi:hypothetical protein